ncbi:MAG: adhesin [Pirellulaceae bacterium]|nr:MAG: adhesin [Pirellulaceae bacterium]
MSKQRLADRGRSKLKKVLRSFETLEDRRLLAVSPWSDGMYYPPIGTKTAYLPPSVSLQQYASISQAQYGGAGFGSQMVGEGTLGFTTVSEAEPNNVLSSAHAINLGTGPNQNNGVAIVGTLATSFAGVGDEDYFAFDLKAGDIIDAVAVANITSQLDLAFYDSAGREIIANQQPVGAGYPLADAPNVPNSPLSTGGTVSLAFVVPADGRYYARLSEAFAPVTTQTYTLTVRAYRPVLESEPVGTVQKVFLDFDGANIRRELFQASGQARLSPLSSFLTGWGLQPSDESRIIDKIINVFQSKFYGALGISSTGGNGDYFATGIPGQFALEILNSRDHADPGTAPNVSRIIIGGTQNELLIPTVGIAQSVDVGNFDTTETAVVLLDSILPIWGGIPRAASVPLEDVLVEAIAAVAAHEAGHFFGAWHTLNNNASDQIMDTGGNPTGLIGVGVDGIFGTPDDQEVVFGTDTYDPLASGIQFGMQNSAAALAWGLSTGKAGAGLVTGKVYEDRNLSRTLDGGDVGLGQVRVYADSNPNGVWDPGEFFVFSGPDGSYALNVPAGTHVIRESVPTGYRLTTNPAVTVNVGVNQVRSNVDFGNERINVNITGVKYSDVNGNGLRDTGEPGIAGVWIYIDLDGDDRIDIGEPATQTAADGSYKLTFPGPGTYTVREVLGPGFVQTFPGPASNYEHTVVMTGDPAIDAIRAAGLDFGNTLLVDFGDAPASYGVARHGFVEGLRLGANWDAEQSSQFSANALGDDVNGATDTSGTIIDDEDGVILTRPLVRGSSNNRLAVTAVNTTGAPAYLHGWIDFNQDGDFNDAGEQVISDHLVGTGTSDIVFAAPGDAQLGQTFARFRYTPQRDIGPTGEVAAGEVEDYLFTVVDRLELAVDDNFSVPRNSVQNVLDVLANDFRLPGEALTIINIQSPSAAGGLVTTDGNVVRYSPPNGFFGTDTFSYTMRNSSGEVDTATVVVNVDLFFDNPVGVDDSFDVPMNSVDVPLNVLANDIEGRNGALTIVSVTQPTQGGTVKIATGGKRLQYTPAPGFGGTETLMYTAADGAGNQVTAKVTLHTLPGDRDDDVVEIRLLATDLNGTPITAIQQGQQFRVVMQVDDLRYEFTNPGPAAGVFSAYADLLYNMQLVSTVPATDPSSGFDFDVTFLNDYENSRSGDASIPGIIDELGAFSTRSTMADPDPVELAAVTFAARAPGLASFMPDPADDPLSEVLLFDTPGSQVPMERIRFIGTTLEIVGDGTQFPLAVDDSLPQSIPSTAVAYPVDVLANDLPGSTGSVRIVSVTDGSFGRVAIDTKNTTDPADDVVTYTPFLVPGGFNGADQFTYTIQDSRGFQSTATVTVRVGNADADDLVALNLRVTDLNGQEITEITAGSQFQLRGYVQDLRGFGVEPRGICGLRRHSVLCEPRFAGSQHDERSEPGLPGAIRS